ncbi:MAG: hypothetical protein R3263_05515, partial [Myxococcota bacterium]|nr:hypothetical protein [Myxococcota bacterium]
MAFGDDERVTPDGTAIRGRRRARGWSRRDLVDAIADASFRASGRRETVTRNELEGMEEAGEAVRYEVLCAVAAGRDCDPVDLVRAAPAEGAAGTPP